MTKQKLRESALGPDSLSDCCPRELRVGFFWWKSFCVADSAVGKDCHRVLGFIALAGEPPILCSSEKL